MAIFIRQSTPDLYLKTALPMIDEVVMARYEQFAPEYPEIFRVLSSTRSIEQTTEVSGFGQFAVTPEGNDGFFDTAVPGYNQTYQPAQYSLGFIVSRIAMDDDKWGVVRKMAVELGKSAHETREVVAANVINGGFSGANGPDGVPLFSTAHPLVKSGGTQTNRAAVASQPSVTSIRLALADMRLTVDHAGKKVRIPPQKLIVPPQLAYQGAELLKGVDRSDTANRAINAFRQNTGMPAFDKLFVYDYLTDGAAWMIEGDRSLTELRFYDREPFNTTHNIQFRSRSIETMGWMRFAVGWNGFYGIYGVPSS